MKSIYVLLGSALWLGQSVAMTFPTQMVISYECKDCESLSHTNLNAHWPLDSNPSGKSAIHKQESLRYRVEVTLAELQKGVPLYTLAPGALIRITPLDKTAINSSPQFQLHKGSQTLSIKDASSLFAEDEALNDTAFNDETLVALQLKPELGVGEFILQDTSHTGKKDSRYLIYVFDKASSMYLGVETDKAYYQYGDELVTTIRLHDSVDNYPIDSIGVRLISTDEKSIPLVLEQKTANIYTATTKLDSLKNPAGQAWYIEAEITSFHDDEIIRRHAHTALSYAIPSAAIVELKHSRLHPLDFSATINVATGSRYALQAILYATNSEGKKQAIQTIQSATWLAPGQAIISFSFPPELAKLYKAPFYIGSIQLIDYGQLKAVYEYNKIIDITKLGLLDA